MLEVISISKTGEQWYLNKVIINPAHISVVAEAEEMNSLLREGKLELGFNKFVGFSKLTMSASSGFNELIVACSPSQILEKISKSESRKLLKG